MSVGGPTWRKYEEEIVPGGRSRVKPPSAVVAGAESAAPLPSTAVTRAPVSAMPPALTWPGNDTRKLGMGRCRSSGADGAALSTEEMRKGGAGGGGFSKRSQVAAGSCALNWPLASVLAVTRSTRSTMAGW